MEKARPEIASIVSNQFLIDNPDLTRDQVEKGLTERFWVYPTLESDFWIPGMGDSFNGAMCCGIPMGEKVVGAVVKPVSNFYLAVEEKDNTETMAKRGINVPPMIAAVGGGDTGIVVSRLLYNVVSLFAESAGFTSKARKVHGAEDLLEFFTPPIAEVHNKGGAHNDFKLGNLGYLKKDETHPDPLFFDWERAMVLKDSQLERKRKGSPIDIDEVNEFNAFEIATIGDLAMFSAYLRLRQFPMGKRDLLNHISLIYNEHREESFGVIRDKQFRELLSFMHTEYLRSQKNRNTFYRFASSQ